MEINKATVMELYEVVRRLQEVVVKQRGAIDNLERRVKELGKDNIDYGYRIYKLEVQIKELKEENKNKKKEFKK